MDMSGKGEGDTEVGRYRDDTAIGGGELFGLRDSALYWKTALGLVVWMAMPGAAFATNGMNAIGFGTESNGMAGADTAMARDTTALNTNPAGLTQLSDRALDIFNGVVASVDVRHQDGFGNDRKVSNTVIPVGGFGYARKYGSLSYGIGFFGQGGSGSVYKNIATAFGTRDELSVLLRIVKLTPGIAVRVNDRLSLGFSASIAYADIKQRVFPNTSFYNPSVSPIPFLGYKIDGAHHISFSPKFGALYRLNDSVTLGASFSPRSSLPLQHGTLVSDQTALGLGKVTYRDVHLDGFALPKEIALGMRVQPNKDWLLSFKLDWLEWSKALTYSSLAASNPDNAAALPSLAATSSNLWKDQWVVVVGGVYQYDTDTVLRWGYNYGRNPIPSQHLNPLLAAISEHHFALGMGRQITPEWNLSFSASYTYSGKVTYTNPELPFGPDAAVTDNFIEAYVMVSRRW